MIKIERESKDFPIEEAQSTDRLDDTRTGQLLVFDQVENVGSCFLHSHLLCRTSVMTHEIVNGLQIDLAGPGAQPPQLQLLLHTTTHLAHIRVSFRESDP